jgi:hypothetical protein
MTWHLGAMGFRFIRLKTICCNFGDHQASDVGKKPLNYSGAFAYAFICEFGSAYRTSALLTEQTAGHHSFGTLLDGMEQRSGFCGISRHGAEGSGLHFVYADGNTCQAIAADR